LALTKENGSPSISTTSISPAPKGSLFLGNLLHFPDSPASLNSHTATLPYRHLPSPVMCEAIREWHRVTGLS
jgi:hypothetical protein